MADAETELRFRDAHLRQLALRFHVSDQGAVHWDDGDVFRQRLDLEIIFCEHWDVIVFVLDASWAPHAECHQTIAHEAGPPYSLP